MTTALAIGLLAGFILFMVFRTPSPLEFIGAEHEWRSAWRRHHRWTLLAAAAVVVLSI